MSDTHVGETGSGEPQRLISPVPRITMQAFCETQEVATAIQSAASDRRMNKAHVKIQMGAAAAAVEAYRSAPTPNVIVIESIESRGNLLGYLDQLAEFCDAGTKVMVIGHVNDVILYRELMRRGVSEYLISPLSVIDFVASVSELFHAPGAEPVGRTISIVGAKGGVGASTVAHNVSWALARNFDMQTVIVDLDIAFGTAGLDFNQDPPQGIAEAIFAPDRVDTALMDKLMSKCSDNLSLLAAPALLDRTCDFTETSLDGILDILRGAIPAIVLDVPHVWTAWIKRTLIASDEIVIVASPDLANLRNAKNLFDLLKQARPNDKRPKVILNQTNMPKRPEISPAEFAKAIGADLSVVIPFDAQLFGTAANNGQMIAEVQPSCRIAETYVDLAGLIIGRMEQKRSGTKSLFEPLIAKLGRGKA